MPPQNPITLGASYVVLPALCLNVDDIQTQLVLLDRPVYSAIARFAHHLPRVFQSAAVSHGHQDLDYDPLECLWADLLHRFQHIVRQRVAKIRVAPFDLFVRGERLFRLFAEYRISPRWRPAFVERNQEGFHRDLRRALIQQRFAPVRDVVNASFGGSQDLRLFEVYDGPREAVGEHAAAALLLFRQFVGR